MGAETIATESQRCCPLCESPGRPKYESLEDRLFGAPGRWNIKECERQDCGSLWLDPRPTPADVGKAYLDYYTHGEPTGLRRVVATAIKTMGREYSAFRYGFQASQLPRAARPLAAGLVRLYPGLAQYLDLLTRYLPADRMGSGRLLDVGCGDGQALEFLAALGWQVSGVEVDPNAASFARGRGLDVRQGTLDQAGFADDSFDAVTSSHVIEHVHDCRAFLADSRKVLKPGGTLVAVTPNARGYTHQLHGRDWLALDPPRHLVLFTRDSLKALAEAAGFRDVRVMLTSRAVALAHIASSEIHRQGRYEWGRWPGLPLWLQAQFQQVLAPVLMRLGRAEGDELVLLATK
jgi:2-polyprenyl-3-methyl-5-hydroxy-6-metoxy-1,4-benzoquinol methylase